MQSAARLVGQADQLLRVGRWALEGALADLGDDPDPTVDNFIAMQQMSRDHRPCVPERSAASPRRSRAVARTRDGVPSTG